MKETSVTDRLTFLAEQFDVFDCSDEQVINKKIESFRVSGHEPLLVRSREIGLNNKAGILAITSTKINDKNRTLKHVSVCSDVFSGMILADPTEHKMYLQWMLNIFSRLIKSGDVEAAIRFVSEDLPQANAYLTLFEDNKRKKKFYDLCKSSYSLKLVDDPTNINQYKSLAQLFDAVDPFIEKEPSAVERTLQKFVDSGQALMPVKDRKFTLYIPKTTEASVVFANFANWCTARVGNGMFTSYTTGNKKPNGKDSDIYIIINNKFFTGESQELYQIHFESQQVKDKANGSNVSIFEDVLQESEGLTNFFKEELMGMAKEYKKGLDGNKYLDFLIKFGFAESLFEMLDENIPTIRFMSREIPKMPDIGRFKQLDLLVICDAKLVDLHPSIGKLTSLELISLTGNKIKSLPKEIGMLKNLAFLNLVGNPIKDIPSEISYLDRSNGGSLYRLGVKEADIGAEAYQRLKMLLPTTTIG